MFRVFEHLPEFLQRHVLNLADAFAGQLQFAPDRFECLLLTAVEAEAQPENPRFPLGQILHELTDQGGFGLILQLLEGCRGIFIRDNFRNGAGRIIAERRIQ